MVKPLLWLEKVRTRVVAVVTQHNRLSIHARESSA